MAKKNKADGSGEEVVESTPAQPVVQERPAETPAQPQPRVFKVERKGASRVGASVRHPRVIGGTCEFCGVIDKNQPAHVQYKLCKHYRGMELRCSYCDETANPDEVAAHHKLNVAEHPDNPDVLVVWCGSYKCSDAHTKRFDPSKK